MPAEVLNFPEQSPEEKIREIIESHRTIEADYWVNKPGDDLHVQHAYQIHGYVDGVLKAKLKELGIDPRTGFMEYSVSMEIPHSVKDNSSLHFVYKLSSNPVVFDDGSMAIPYDFHIFDQDSRNTQNTKDALVNGKLKIVGPLKRELKKAA